MIKSIRKWFVRKVCKPQYIKYLRDNHPMDSEAVEYGAPEGIKEEDMIASFKIMGAPEGNAVEAMKLYRSGFSLQYEPHSAHVFLHIYEEDKP